MDSLSLEEKIGQLFTIGIGGTTIDGGTRDLLREMRPGGVCLFARNIREAEQTRVLLDGLREELGDPILSIDQEGGLVDRLRRLMTPMPATDRLRTAEDAAELGTIVAETLRILGFNTDFAPVLDVIDAERAERQNGLFSREFGRSAEDVVELAGAFLESLQNGGIIGCAKHFPGLGGATVDSHEELPRIDVAEDRFEAIDLLPYRSLLGAGQVHAVMVAHATFSGLDLQEKDGNGKLLPSSLSYNLTTTLLRERLAFGGLVITDDLEMGAIVKNYGTGEACKMAVLAGADMLAICAAPDRIREGFAAVLAACKAGEISMARLDESINRIAAFKARMSAPLDFDQQRLTQISDQISSLTSRLNS